MQIQQLNLTSDILLICHEIMMKLLISQLSDYFWACENEEAMWKWL